jgi:hypothetical protein
VRTKPKELLKKEDGDYVPGEDQYKIWMFSNFMKSSKVVYTVAPSEGLCVKLGLGLHHVLLEHQLGFQGEGGGRLG